MVLDEPKESDQTVLINNQMFIFDSFTAKTFDEPLKLDYSELQGYKLSTPSEILAYGIHLSSSV
ncbi:hypothetical protein TEPIDINF_001546 [Tepidibacillus infernus]|uniref:Uncharacterized protein n=1 Tax=Tepidibacillus decaturensis TaxID=1413211 RepID=A0A135L521_9BACI|nr:hypothetical protein [Tepidibacillus sp. HK-1]KXG44066.1 hypothetical protein U473_08645 [Tepidibacillus decaturensis]